MTLQAKIVKVVGRVPGRGRRPGGAPATPNGLGPRIAPSATARTAAVAAVVKRLGPANAASSVQTGPATASSATARGAVVPAAVRAETTTPKGQGLGPANAAVATQAVATANAANEMLRGVGAVEGSWYERIVGNLPRTANPWKAATGRVATMKALMLFVCRL